MSRDPIEHVLVIDLGTGGPKAGLVNRDGNVAACTSAPCQVFFLPGGGVEHDPAEWWTAIKTCVKKVLHDSRVSTRDIIAVAVTTMWGVTVAVDEHGEPLMRAMSWMDVRGAKYNRELVKGFPMVEGYQLGLLLKYVNKHGFPPSASDPLGHMLWIKNEKPEIYKRTYKFLEPMDYITMKLTGRFTATQNTVLPMLLCDNRRLDRTEYDPWLLKMSTVDPSKFPELLPINGIIGPITDAAARELGLEPGTTIVCPVNDNSTSAIGAGSIGESEPAACMGNSGHMAFHLKSKKTDLFHTMATIPSGIKDTYLFWADLGNNARALDTALKMLLVAPDTMDTDPVPQDIYARADRIAEPIPPGSGGVIFLPWLNGSISPGQDEYLRGGFINLSHSTGRAHMVRAVFEGLSMNWRWLREPAEKLAGRKFQYWRLTGGGALSDVWAQTMADVVGLPMHRQANPRNHNVLGMGFLAFNRLGKLDLEEIPGMIKFDRVFEPDPKNQPVYDHMYAQFSAAREKMRPVFHALNKS